MSKIFNWAIVGPGRIAHKFASDLAQIPNARLYALWARRPEQAQAFAQTYGAEKCYSDIELLLADPQVHAVYIASPHALHYAQARMALERGKPVLCEKPLCINAKQIETLIQLSEKHQVFLMEAMWSRFLPHMLRALEIIASGKLGAPQKLIADFGFDMPYQPEHRIFNPNLGGGSLLDVGIYPAFLAYMCMGLPAKIEASATFSPSGVDSNTHFSFHYSNGASAHLASFIDRKTPTEATFIGTLGMLKWAGRFHEPNAGIAWQVFGQDKVFEPFTYNNLGYKYEIEAAMQAINSGEIECKEWAHADSLALGALLDEVRQKIHLQYPLAIEDI